MKLFFFFPSGAIYGEKQKSRDEGHMNIEGIWFNEHIHSWHSGLLHPTMYTSLHRTETAMGDAQCDQCQCKALPSWLSGNESDCHAGKASLIPGWGRSPGGGHGKPLHYSCLENPMDRGSWRATVHGAAKNWTRLSVHTHTQMQITGISNGPGQLHASSLIFVFI